MERPPSIHFCAPSFDSRSTHLGEELADVLLFLVRMSDVCGVDLARAAAEKMKKNRRNYPAERCFGSSAKHTSYVAEGGEGGAVAAREGGGGARGGDGGGAGGGGGGGGGGGSSVERRWGGAWASSAALAALAPLAAYGAICAVAALRARA